MIAGSIDWTAWARSLAIAAETARRAQAVALGSLDVMTMRLVKVGAAASRGAPGDYVEQARWLPEKVAAFGAAGAIVSAAWWEGQALLLHGMRRNAAVFKGSSPASAAKASEVWRHAMNTAFGVMGVAARCGRDALKPVEAVVTANRRRLFNEAAGQRRRG